MDVIIQFFINWGYLGLFISALIAGTVVPLSSEVVLVACIGLKLDPILCTLMATLGNMLGGMTCYGLGYLGKMEYIEKYFGVKQDKIHKAEKFIHDKGAWMAFFSFIPFLGEAIGVTLGLMRANVRITMFSMFIGKAFRYIAITLSTLGIISAL